MCYDVNAEQERPKIREVGMELEKVSITCSGAFILCTSSLITRALAANAKDLRRQLVRMRP